MKKNKKGISIVTLVISIIVMVILATVAIIKLGQTNILKNARQATFKQNLENYITELSMYVGDEIEKNVELDQKTINATSETIATLITSIKEEDKEKFAVIGGNVVYKGNNLDEQIWCEELGIGSISEYDEINQVNTPKLAEGMIPVRYDDESSSWVKADVTNKNNDWYKYDDVERKWANIVTVKAEGTKTRKYYLDAPNGTPIAMEDVTTMFVWIPRYAYSINEGYYRTADTLSEEDERSNQKIDISFLVGTTNSSFDGATYTTYDTDYIADSVWPGEATPKIVHPAFKFGDDLLTGIWVAKFEAGWPPDDEYIAIIPNVSSRVNTSIENSQKFCIEMKQDEKNKYGFDAVAIDTHLIKNTEWGAVAYLSVSSYGKTPMINSKAISKTGYQGADNEYNTEQGAKASTTHNIYGVYDMNGCKWEYVAAYYDNGSGKLSGEYFERYKVKKEYEKYWDVYEVSREEQEDKIVVKDLGDGVTEVARAELFRTEKTINGSVVNTKEWNEARYRIVTKIYEKMSKIKGDAMYETIGTYGYYGAWYSGSAWIIHWLLNESSTTPSWGEGWNKDRAVIGIVSYSYIRRSCNYTDSVGAGAFGFAGSPGNSTGDTGFRPTCIVY